MNKKYEFYETVAPIKLSEGRQINLFTKCWGLLTEYELESVKINNNKDGVSSVATLRICDNSGQATCLIKGYSVGLLFGLSAEEWKDVEKMCPPRQQLYYRYFKKGISSNFNYEQKLFYSFCATHQKNDVLVARFTRCVNTRNVYRSDALLDIIDLWKCDTYILDLYNKSLRNYVNYCKDMLTFKGTNKEPQQWCSS